MQINYCSFFSNEFFILIHSLSCHEYQTCIESWTLSSIYFFLLMQFIKSFINDNTFIKWHWIKLVLQFCADNFLIVFKLNFYSIFLWYIHNLSDFWSYNWVSNYYLINQIWICILVNLNFKWNADILIDCVRQHFRILSENSFADICCVRHIKQINQNSICFVWF